ncbi:MAG: dipeptide epimerase [Xanthomonadales bacterium]|nr:dipeptide epimerase [Xanthomonadales bacterium]
MKITFSIDHWELKDAFITSQETVFHIETLTVYLDDGRTVGRGEALGVDYFGETAQSLSHQVMEVAPELEDRLEPVCREGNSSDPLLEATRRAVQGLLPAGGARNALDCALWDLACRRTGRRAWDLLDRSVGPMATGYTLSLASADAMAEEARAQSGYHLLKLKLDADDVAARVEAVRRARPDAELIIDANGAWDRDLLERLGDTLGRHGIGLLEQPLPRGAEDDLAGLNYPVPLCADESCQSTEDLDALVDRFDAVNIKLDKTGGLTEALAVVERARALGFDLMVGNMLGSSLAMAPAFIIAQDCRWVDLDGPLWQRADRDHPVRYDGELMNAPEASLWG